MKAIAVLPQGLEQEGAKELHDLGAKNLVVANRSVSFEADMSSFYRMQLQSLLPFRFLRELGRFSCDSPKSLYFGVQNLLDSNNWLNPSMTFRVDVTGQTSALNHTHFTALQVKNALIDLQREYWGKRSSIDVVEPDICFHLHLNRNIAVLSLASSSRSMHRRGYRVAMGKAPLKENIAAGLIRLTGWNGQVPIVDLFCGSGTFLIEAANIAFKKAPGLEKSFLIKNWVDFDSYLWEKETEKARNIQLKSRKIPYIEGCENDPDIARQAEINVINSKLDSHIIISKKYFNQLSLPHQKGIIVCNPPYGKRIGHDQDLESLYEEIGDFVKRNASGWELWLLSGNKKLTRSIQMKSSKRFPISNGGIDCRWLQYKIN